VNLYAVALDKKPQRACLCQSKAKVAISDFESLQKAITLLQNHWRNISGKSGNFTFISPEHVFENTLDNQKPRRRTCLSNCPEK